VWKGQVIDFTQKRLRADLVGSPEAERLVRSHDNGWVHSHTLDPFVEASRKSIEEIAVSAVCAFNFNLEAVDILAIYSVKKDGRPLVSAKVCEINTAPGLENTRTVAAYSDAVDKWYKELKGRSCLRPGIGANKSIGV